MGPEFINWCRSNNGKIIIASLFCCSYDLEENDGVDEVVDLEENDGVGWLSARRSATSNPHGKKSQNQHY